MTRSTPINLTLPSDFFTSSSHSVIDLLSETLVIWVHLMPFSICIRWSAEPSRTVADRARWVHGSASAAFRRTGYRVRDNLHAASNLKTNCSQVVSVSWLDAGSWLSWATWIPCTLLKPASWRTWMQRYVFAEFVHIGLTFFIKLISFDKTCENGNKLRLWYHNEIHTCSNMGKAWLMTRRMYW